MSATLTHFIIISVILSSCASDKEKAYEELSKKVNRALRSDNKIDENEWTGFSNHILENKQQFSDLVADNKINFKRLSDFILEVAHKRRGQVDPEIFSPTKTEQISTNAVVNLYIENSGSMDGYVRGIKEFETVVANLLVKSKNFSKNSAKGNFNIHLINKAIFPVPQVQDLVSFAQSLDPRPGSIFKQTGKTGESKINKMIEMVLNQTGKDNLSIFISDCIYSIGPKKDANGSLAYQQAGALDAFLNKLRNSKSGNFTTAVFKFTSGFEGKYYSFDHTNKWIDNKRPYYIWILGEGIVVENFVNSIKIEEQVGFNNSYYLSDFRKIQPYFTVLSEKNTIGKFKPSIKGTKSDNLRDISSLEYENGIFQFSVAIDLRNIPVDASYLINPKNYIVPDGFNVKSIEKVDRNQLSPKDINTVERTTATHIITVATSNKFSIQNLKLELLNKIPAWVEESNTMDDRDVLKQSGKTFGLLYLIRGISEAYSIRNPEQKSYFNINIKIKK